jgi:redox-sensitive bicupin YhaK (pirin superfamily)
MSTLLTSAILPGHEVVDGPGLRIHRSIPQPGLPNLGPLLLLDHFGPRQFPPDAAFPPNPHPHAGIETLSYLFDGAIEHADSAGGAASVASGEALWMRSGRGIIHDEQLGAPIRRHGGVMEAVQIWINMPKGRKQEAPVARVLGARDMPSLALGAARLRLLAGRVAGQAGPLATFADPFIAHLSFAAAGDATIPLPPGVELALYVVSGAIYVAENRLLGPHDLARVEAGVPLSLAAMGSAEALILGGPALDAPIVRQGPFVMNTDAEIEDAVRDFRSGRMGWIDGDRIVSISERP